MAGCPVSTPAGDGIIAVAHSFIDCFGPDIVTLYLDLIEQVSRSDGTLAQHNARVPKKVSETITRVSKAVLADPNLPEAPEAMFVASFAALLLKHSTMDGLTYTKDNIPSEN